MLPVIGAGVGSVEHAAFLYDSIRLARCPAPTRGGIQAMLTADRLIAEWIP